MMKILIDMNLSPRWVEVFDDEGWESAHWSTIGDFGAISFHDTKNITCGEGGVLLINNEKFIEKADIAWSCGTNKKEYLNNQVDKYSWTDIGLSFTPSEITAAFLYSSLLETEELTKY